MKKITLTKLTQRRYWLLGLVLLLVMIIIGTGLSRGQIGDLGKLIHLVASPLGRGWAGDPSSFVRFDDGGIAVGDNTIRITRDRMDMGAKPIINLATPVATGDAATKGYVDAQVGTRWTDCYLQSAAANITCLAGYTAVRTTAGTGRQTPSAAFLYMTTNEMRFRFFLSALGLNCHNHAEAGRRFECVNMWGLYRSGTSAQVECERDAAALASTIHFCCR